MKTWKKVISAAAIIIAIAGLFVIGSVLKSRQADGEKLERLNGEIVALVKHNKTLESWAAEAIEKADAAGAERDALKETIAEMKKRAPKKPEIPKICTTALPEINDLDMSSIVNHLCEEIALQSKYGAFYFNLSLEYEKAIAAGDVEISGLREANKNLNLSIANHKALGDLQQQKFNVQLSIEKRKKYRWGAGGFLLGVLVMVVFGK